MAVTHVADGDHKCRRCWTPATHVCVTFISHIIIIDILLRTLLRMYGHRTFSPTGSGRNANIFEILEKITADSYKETLDELTGGGAF